jgi:Family of unknown function (DUF5677)
MDKDLIPKVIEHASQLREAVAQLDIITSDISRVPFTTGSREEVYDIIRRAAIIRQREAIDAIISLCETGHSAFAVCLLRPAYEELLWLEYLAKHTADAPKLVLAHSQKIIAESMRAQSEYLGKKGMHAAGFSMTFVKRFLAQAAQSLTTLKTTGAKLGWRQGAHLPTLTHIAQEVGRKNEYDFLYEATSRYVHFSPHELMRRAWGDHREVRISSSHFTGYWSAFALHWSLRIYVSTILACADLFPDDSEHNAAFDRFMELWSNFVPPVPILTSEELKWPPATEQALQRLS